MMSNKKSHMKHGTAMGLVFLSFMLVFGAVLVSLGKAQGTSPHPGSNVTTKIKSVEITSVNAIGGGISKPVSSWRIKVDAQFTGTLHHSTVFVAPRSGTQVGSIRYKSFSMDGSGVVKFTIAKSLGFTSVDIYTLAADILPLSSGELAIAKDFVLDVPLQ